jgi:hypothetical protein
MPDWIITMVTTTAYGSWLPGDTRGYVSQGQLLPPNPRLEAAARAVMKQQAVTFTRTEKDNLFDALVAATREFGYHLSDVAVEAWHVHWIVAHSDQVPAMVAHLKTRMRQRLGRGRIWTEGYCHRILRSREELLDARAYVARHPGCCLVNERILRGAMGDQRENDGLAGGSPGGAEG